MSSGRSWLWPSQPRLRQRPPRALRMRFSITSSRARCVTATVTARAISRESSRACLTFSGSASPRSVLTPLYASSFYHNYFASDFDSIDPAFGTMEDYRRLVRAVHARGMKIYLDEEFQYVAYDHRWFRSALGNPKNRLTATSSFSTDPITQYEARNPDRSGSPLPRASRGQETGITTINM